MVYSPSTMHQTLYRKYRSTSLSELVGQRHIIQVLTNAIALDRLSHAYIFSGPRGTGKTSTARILAKMVNKTTESIDDCPICQKIVSGHCVDVIEIDAASHTGVDHMRQLIDQIKFMPIEAAVKVFIIDEAHMLSTGAFNALLKTLEEPPSHGLFILATTDMHKIPATIQSRAQTLSFRPILNQDIANHLQFVCDQESIAIDALAIQKIVSYANGGMRDALSLLDQLISMSANQQVQSSDVDSVLGYVQDDQIMVFLNQCMGGNRDMAVASLRQFIDDGFDVFLLLDQFIGWLSRELFQQQGRLTIDKHIISEWLVWFSETMARLKVHAYPELIVQVMLFSHIGNATAPDQPNAPTNAIQSTQVSSKPKRTVRDATVASRPTKDSGVMADAQTQTELTQTKNIPTTGPKLSKKPRVPSALSEYDMWKRVIEKLPNAFKMMRPILSEASFSVSSDIAYLTIDPSYRFFQKKLSEPKYKLSMTSVYEDCSGQSLSDIVVLLGQSNAPTPTSNTPKVTDSEQPIMDASSTIQTKTFNQVIELFEGNVVT